MSETHSENDPADTSGDGSEAAQGATGDAERQAIAEGQEQLDARSEGEGLAAEAGRAEETGIAQG